MEWQLLAVPGRKWMFSPFTTLIMDGLNNDCDLWNGENCVSVKRVSTPTGWNYISMKYSTNRVLMLLC